MVELILCDISHEMVAAWRTYFADVPIPNKRILNCSLSELPCDGLCVVSPSNSFGHFTGGVDAAIARYAFPSEPHKLTHIAQDEIKNKFSGMVPVGSCHIMPINENLPFLAICPTMRCPATILDPKSTIPYDCTFAALNAVLMYNRQNHSNRIKRLIMFGFGTGVGELSYDHCAKMMALACKHFIRLQNIDKESSAFGFRITQNQISKISRELRATMLGRV